MRELAEALEENLKLLCLWFRRILFSPDHFHTPLYRRIWLSFHGYVPDQYALYDLKHNDMNDYLSEFDWYKSRKINGREAYILNHKAICSQMLSQYVQVPKVLCLKKKTAIVSDRGLFLAPDDLLRLLKKEGKTIYKPLDAGKGKNIFTIEFRGDACLINGRESDADELIKKLNREKGWFISAYIEQSQYLKDIFPDSANTLRLITVRNEDRNAVELLFAIQRFGRKNTIPVDNASQGGLVAKIDLSSGVMSEARTLHSLDVFYCHPDSGAKICGMKIPHWDELKAQIVALAEKFIYLDFIAWDVLQTDNGFYIIEANASSGVNIIQLWGGQRNGELGKIYRRYGIIK